MKINESDKYPTIYTSNPFKHLGEERVNCGKEKVIELLEQYAGHYDRERNPLDGADWLSEMHPSLTFEEPKTVVSLSFEGLVDIVNKYMKYRSFSNYLPFEAWLKENHPSLTFTEPFKERVMMVSDDEENWEERTVFYFSGKHNFYVAWGNKPENWTMLWKYAKELPTITEYTIEEKIGNILENLPNVSEDKLKTINSMVDDILQKTDLKIKALSKQEGKEVKQIKSK